MDCPRAELGDGLRKSSGSTSRESQLWPLLTLERNTETAFALRPHNRNVIVSVLGRPRLGSYLANFTIPDMSLMANESCTTHNESLDNIGCHLEIRLIELLLLIMGSEHYSRHQVTESRPQLWRRMAATRRLQKELGDLRKAASKSFRDIQVRKRSSLLFQAGLGRAEPSGYNEAINAGGRV